MVAADVSSIKGEIRADFLGIWGAALNHAGRNEEKGKMYILMPKIVVKKQQTISYNSYSS